MMFEKFRYWCSNWGGVEPVDATEFETLEEELLRLEREFAERQRRIEELKQERARELKEREKQLQRDFGVYMAKGSSKHRQNRY